MMPPAYFKWLSSLQDKAKAMDWNSTSKVIKEDLGGEWEIQ